jgi:hypothetical protein
VASVSRGQLRTCSSSLPPAQVCPSSTPAVILPRRMQSPGGQGEAGDTLGDVRHSDTAQCHTDIQYSPGTEQFLSHLSGGPETQASEPVCGQNVDCEPQAQRGQGQGLVASQAIWTLWALLSLQHPRSPRGHQAQLWGRKRLSEPAEPATLPGGQGPRCLRHNKAGVALMEAATRQAQGQVPCLLRSSESGGRGQLHMGSERWRRLPMSHSTARQMPVLPQTPVCS